MQHTTWHAHVRIENHGKYAEYNDRIGVTGPDNVEPTRDDVIDHAKNLIVDAHPGMKAGQVVTATARKIGG
jgi:hypothetical protein